MKKKNKKAILRKRKEFRYYATYLIKKNKTIKIHHPAYIFLEKGNEYIFVTITHSSNVPGKTVIKLRKNPNPYDKKDAFRIKNANVDNKDSFGKRRKGWKINELDDQEIRDEYKKR